MSNLRNAVILLVGIGLGVGLYAATEFSNKKLSFTNPITNSNSKEQVIVREKSDVVDMVKEVGPSVVSIAIKRQARNPFSQDPFDLFHHSALNFISGEHWKP